MHKLTQYESISDFYFKNKNYSHEDNLDETKQKGYFIAQEIPAIYDIRGYVKELITYNVRDFFILGTMEAIKNILSE